MYDLTDEEIAMVKRHRAQRYVRFTEHPSTPGLQTVTIPQELVASIFFQITMDQIKARGQQEQVEKGIARSPVGWPNARFKSHV